MHRIRHWLASTIAVLAGIALPVLGPAAGHAARAAEVTVAVAANFAEPLESLVADFERRSGHRVRTVIASTGTLYAQIVNGAPFDVLLAADQRRPRLLGESDHAVADSRFTYAVGRLTLWSANPALLDGDGARVLREGTFRRLVIANPDLAPYGEAARETLQELGAWERVQPRLIRTENIAGTFTVVASGNAEIGLVALSYVLSPRNPVAGSRWDVPASLHAPIRQDAVLLRRGAANEGARALLDHLRSDEARGVIERFGYGVD